MNTFTMRTTFSRRCTAVLFTVVAFFSACKSPNDEKISSPQYAAPIELPQQTETSQPPLADLKPIDPDIWDTTQTDISHIDPKRKLIAFTFDDSPARTLENIFAVFAAFNEENPDCKASATVFFNGGLFSDDTPQLLYAACALGFELGNHTHSHADLTKLSKEELQSEIDQTDALLQQADKKNRHLLRAPFGKTNDLVKELSPTPIIDWTIDTLDWTGVCAEEIYQSVYYQRFSGAIVLMHDGYQNTVDALKRLLPDLKADGYQVVTVSQLAKAHGCKLRRGKTYIRARKQQTSS